MEYKWLKDFIALKELGNFSAAAKDRFVTQSALSRRIQALETWIGVPLFDRATYPIELTEEGEKFVPYVEHLLQFINNTKSDFSRSVLKNERQIRIDCLHSFSTTLVPEMLAENHEMLQRYTISLNPSIHDLENQFQSLLEVSSDFLITYYSTKIRPELLLEDQLQSMTLWYDKIVAVISPRLLEKLSADDSYPFLAYAEKTFLYNLISPLMLNSPVQLHTTVEATLSNSLVKMALQGLGMTFVPLHAVKDELAQGTLIQPFDFDKNINAQLRILCYRSLHNKRDAVEEVWQHLRYIAKKNNSNR